MIKRETHDPNRRAERSIDGVRGWGVRYRPPYLLLSRRVIMILFVLVAAASGWGHPHIWFESRVILRPATEYTPVAQQASSRQTVPVGAARYSTPVGPAQAVQVGLEWTFDHMFTEMILADFDEDRDRRLSAIEIEAIEAEAFSNLRHYNYFVTLRINGDEVRPTRIVEFSARVENNRLIYRFFLPEYLPQEFAIAVFDDTYYCAVDYPEDVLIVEGMDDRHVIWEQRRDTGRVARFETSHGVAGIFGGSQTAIGEEILLRITEE